MSPDQRFDKKRLLFVALLLLLAAGIPLGVLVMPEQAAPAPQIEAVSADPLGVPARSEGNEPEDSTDQSGQVEAPTPAVTEPADEPTPEVDAAPEEWTIEGFVMDQAFTPLEGAVVSMELHDLSSLQTYFEYSEMTPVASFGSMRTDETGAFRFTFRHEDFEPGSRNLVPMVWAKWSRSGLRESFSRRKVARPNSLTRVVINMHREYHVRVTNPEGLPVADADVSLSPMSASFVASYSTDPFRHRDSVYRGDGEPYTCRTDQTGRATLVVPDREDTLHMIAMADGYTYHRLEVSPYVDDVIEFTLTRTTNAATFEFVLPDRSPVANAEVMLYLQDSSSRKRVPTSVLREIPRTDDRGMVRIEDLPSIEWLNASLPDPEKSEEYWRVAVYITVRREQVWETTSFEDGKTHYRVTVRPETSYSNIYRIARPEGLNLGRVERAGLALEYGRSSAPGDVRRKRVGRDDEKLVVVDWNARDAKEVKALVQMTNVIGREFEVLLERAIDYPEEEVLDVELSFALSEFTYRVYAMVQYLDGSPVRNARVDVELLSMSDGKQKQVRSRKMWTDARGQLLILIDAKEMGDLQDPELSLQYEKTEARISLKPGDNEVTLTSSRGKLVVRYGEELAKALPVFIVWGENDRFVVPGKDGKYWPSVRAFSPFQRSIEIGWLRPGRYTVRVETSWTEAAPTDEHARGLNVYEIEVTEDGDNILDLSEKAELKPVHSNFIVMHDGKPIDHMRLVWLRVDDVTAMKADVDRITNYFYERPRSKTGQPGEYHLTLLPGRYFVRPRYSWQSEDTLYMCEVRVDESSAQLTRLHLEPVKK